MTFGGFHFSAPLWQYSGAESWFFVSVPGDLSDDIAQLTAGVRKGFGSVRVDVTVGGTSWQTSLFPDRRTGSYLLPVKKSVRTGENLSTGDDVEVRLRLLDL